jgi:LPXTG-motif cell wall-anchored protein
MRQVAIVGLTIAAILVFGQVIVLGVAGTASASEYLAPALQATATVTAPGSLPETGADSAFGLPLIGAIVLIALGVAIVTLLASRRTARS